MQSTDFLRALSSSARTNARERTAPIDLPFAGDTSFIDTLAKAKEGLISSGSTIKIAKGAEVSLTPDQLKRVSAAADLAEANGAGRALILIDGQALKLDVPTRTIIGAAEGSSTAVMPDIDSVISAASTGTVDKAAAAPLGPPAANYSGLHNLSLRNTITGFTAAKNVPVSAP